MCKMNRNLLPIIFFLFSCLTATVWAARTGGSTEVQESKTNNREAFIASYYQADVNESFEKSAYKKIRSSLIEKEFDEEGEDSENGVAGIQAYYFGARMYDADVGIWLSTDPAGQYWNSYKYASNPISYVDPDGRFFGLSMFLTGAAVGYIRHGVINDDWGTQAIKSGLWTGAAVYTVSNPKYALQALTLMQTSQGIANVHRTRLKDFSQMSGNS